MWVDLQYHGFVLVGDDAYLVDFKVHAAQQHSLHCMLAGWENFQASSGSGKCENNVGEVSRSGYGKPFVLTILLVL
jgi:hypothetical protein